MSSEASVLIVGAGPSGLILALALRQNNIPVRIIEKDTAWHLGTRGPGIQPRSLELFNFLGTLPDIMKEGMAPLPMEIHLTLDGKEVIKKVNTAETEGPTPDVPFRNPHIISQAINEEVHRKHLAKYGTEVELGTELISFVQDENGVTAEVLCRKDGQETKQTIRVKYLVSAEGARSVIRKQLSIPFVGQPHDPMRMVITDIHIKGISADTWYQWGSMDTKAVWFRTAEHNGIFSVMTFGKHCNIDLLKFNRQALIDFIVEVTKRDDLEFGEIVWQSEWKLNVRMAERFGEGRVFLIGDAAHVHSPAGGQGLNTGLQDAFNLAWKLSLSLAHPSVPRTLLDSYQAERLPVVKEMLSRTTELMKKKVASGAEGGKQQSDSKTGQALQSKILHQMGVNYRWSPIVVDEQPKTEREEEVSGAYRPEDPSVLKAGDRAPDSPGLVRVEGGEEKKTLFEIFKPMRHTVLLFGEDVKKYMLEVLKQAPEGTVYTVLVTSRDVDIARTGVDAIFVDIEGHARTYYPPAEKGFKTIIIRPDGVVGAIVKGKEGTEKYLKGIFGM